MAVMALYVYTLTRRTVFDFIATRVGCVAPDKEIFCLNASIIVR